MPYIASMRPDPDASGPEEFPTASRAWGWLADMRRNHEDTVDPYPAWDEPYSEVVDQLEAIAIDGEEDRTGLVIGFTPGDRPRDQGMVYTVTFKPE